MKVSKLALIAPILFIGALILGAVFFMEQKEVLRTTAGYQYTEKLFRENEVGEINIKTTDEDWQSIIDDPTREQYVSANITVNGETYESVGIRAKGNSSLTSVANSESNRYSLKIDFTEYNDSQTYYGLEKLNLNSNFSDSTQMKEFISYELMEQMNMTVPAHSYVKVHVNGEYYGLMLAVEEIGAAFAKTNYGSTNGFIFKPENEGADLKYVSDDVDDYSGIFDGVKMNEKTVEISSKVIAMLKEISEGNTDSLDVQQIAKYFAVNTALVNLDSYQGSFKHNYYLYENANGQFSVIPWDYNMSFGGFGGGGMGRGNIQNNEAEATEQTETVAPKEQQVPNEQMAGGMMQGGSMMTDSTINFSITEPVSGTTIDERPLLKIMLEDEEAWKYYEQYLQQFATEIFTEENVASMTAPLKDLLYDAIDSDPTKFSTTEQFIAGVEGDESLAAFAKARSTSILQQLAGEIEGVTGAESSVMPGGGGMPNMEEMPEGMTPPTDGEMPEGFTPPANGEMPEEMTPPTIGEAPPQNGVAEFPTEQQPKSENNETAANERVNRPPTDRANGGANPYGAQQQEQQSIVTTKTVWTVVASLFALIVALVAISWLSNRKYKR